MSKRHRDDAIDLSDTTEVVSMLWLAASYLEARGYKPRRGDEIYALFQWSGTCCNSSKHNTRTITQMTQKKWNAVVSSRN